MEMVIPAILMGVSRTFLCIASQSQWLYRVINLIQKTTGVKLDFDRSRFWDFMGGGRSIEMVIPVRIIVVSRIFLLYSLTVTMVV